MSPRTGNIIKRIVLPQKGQWAVRFTQGVLGTIALAGAAYQLGWGIQPGFGSILSSVTAVAVAVFALLETLLWITHQESRSYWSNNRFFIIVSAALFFPAAIAYGSFSSAAPEKTALQVVLLIGIQLALGIAGLLRLVRITHMPWFAHIHPGFIAAESFAAAIALGTVLLKTPKATFPGADLSWIDALFQSASAVCVTGLITVDTELIFTTTDQRISWSSSKPAAWAS